MRLGVLKDGKGGQWYLGIEGAVPVLSRDGKETGITDEGWHWARCMDSNQVLSMACRAVDEMAQGAVSKWKFPIDLGASRLGHPTVGLVTVEPKPGQWGVSIQGPKNSYPPTVWCASREDLGEEVSGAVWELVTEENRRWVHETGELSYSPSQRALRDWYVEPSGEVGRLPGLAPSQLPALEGSSGAAVSARARRQK